jgi:hypothetical protein
MPKPEATAAVVFKITSVEDRLLLWSDKIIIEFARVIEIIIAKIKYLDVFLYSMKRFSVYRSDQLEYLLSYKVFFLYYPQNSCIVCMNSSI